MFTNRCSTSKEEQVEEEEEEEEKSWSNFDGSAEDISKSAQENHNDDKQNKKKGKKGQDEVATVNTEVAEFMKYLHNVSKLCPDDYNYITQGALKYSEDFYMACIENLASLPHLYQICEMTSLTGGTFDQGLALTFEKELLIMPISSDANAEKLSSHYEPHVCLTQDALVTLLDNHGP
ncbi:hypothetical protein CRUP_030516 [Coryphaenoides rupestris]|nr:hypothetical protein CRUP_030516 [Coryphaenoides rupestris]